MFSCIVSIEGEFLVRERTIEMKCFELTLLVYMFDTHITSSDFFLFFFIIHEQRLNDTTEINEVLDFLRRMIKYKGEGREGGCL
jgi:hypothetical protein